MTYWLHDYGRMHIYAQVDPHDSVIIRGNRRALEDLRDALNRVLEGEQESESTATTADGEGYPIKIHCTDLVSGLGPVPYTNEYYSIERARWFERTRFIMEEAVFSKDTEDPVYLRERLIYLRHLAQSFLGETYEK